MTGLRDGSKTPFEVTEQVVAEARCGFARPATEKIIKGEAKSIVCYACGNVFTIGEDGAIYFTGQCTSTPTQET